MGVREHVAENVTRHHVQLKLLEPGERSPDSGRQNVGEGQPDVQLDRARDRTRHHGPKHTPGD